MTTEKDAFVLIIHFQKMLMINVVPFATLGKKQQLYLLKLTIQGLNVIDPHCCASYYTTSLRS